MEDTVLVVNCGSSSLKLALFNNQHRKLVSALAERLGQSDAFAHIDGQEGTIPLDASAGHDQALDTLVTAFRDLGLMTTAPSAIGHRVAAIGAARP